MPITALPTPPSRNDPTNFAERGDAFMAALPTFVTEANALQTDVNAKQATTSTAAATATTKADEASASATTAGQHKDAAQVARGAAELARDEAQEHETNAAGSAATAAAHAASIDPNILGGMRVMGLTGNVNAATPLTKYDLSASMVTLRNAAGGTYTDYSTATLTCDLGLAGPAANGRDQAGAFAANSWIYLYRIWNGATRATLASTTPPASFTGATLPTGYTHWVFCTVIRWNASSNIVPMTARGSKISFDVAAGGVNRAVAGVTNTTMTAISLAALVPPIALRAQLGFFIAVTHTVANVEFSALVRPTGSTITGFLAGSVVSQVAGVQAFSLNAFDMALGTSQSIDYRITALPGTNGGLFLDVHGFTIPNGDA